nr:SURF1 family cytochrome oxidase biogenesis protein [Microbacterium hydrocarbonoxydans]
MLLLCLLVAGVFAWLGQWQLGRAVDTAPQAPGATEEVRPLTEVVDPGEYLPEPLVGQKVETEGRWIAGDFIVVSSRFNDGAQGYWVTGQLRVDERTSIAVAVGWAPDRESADAAAKRLEADADGGDVTVSGRLISDEGPVLPTRDDPERLDRMSPAALLSRWHDVEQLDVYRPYLASTTATAGLIDISSPAPEEGSSVNWLNIFYAVEWAIFAGFAFYLWYRLAKDAWEREVEEFEDAASA